MNVRRPRSEGRLRLVLLDHAVPLVAGCGAAVAVLWNALARFGATTFVGNDSGMQGLWNVWWAEQALRGPRWILDCDVLFHPDGATLVASDLGPTSAVPLAMLSLAGLGRLGAVTVFAGLSIVLVVWLQFLAARRLGLGRVPSLAAGLALAAGPAHVAALANGQVSLFGAPWVCLFLLASFEALERPSAKTGALAGAALAVVAWSDFALLFATSLAAVVVTFGHGVGATRSLLGRDFAKAVGAGALVFGLGAGPLLAQAVLAVSAEGAWVGVSPWVAGHDAQALIVPGAHQALGRVVPHLEGWGTGAPYLGVVLIVLCGYAIAAREKLALSLTLAGLAIAALSLGAYLRWGGEAHLGAPLPFRLAIRWLPLVEELVDPARMSFVAAACLTLAGAQGLWELWDGFGAKRVVAVVGALLLLAEAAPAPLAAAPVAAVAGLGPDAVPGGGAVLDVYEGVDVLRHQMQHGAPLVNGYGTRLPASRFAALARDPVVELLRRPPGAPGARYERLDPGPSFDWGDGAPHPDVPADHFEVRWAGQILVPFAGRWRFYADLDTDARLRLEVAGRPVIDALERRAPGRLTGEARLAEGLHDLEVHYLEGTGPAQVRIAWGRGDAAPVTIPETALRSAGEAAGLRGQYAARSGALPDGGAAAAREALRRRGVATILAPAARGPEMAQRLGLEVRLVEGLAIARVPVREVAAPSPPDVPRRAPAKGRRRR